MKLKSLYIVLVLVLFLATPMLIDAQSIDAVRQSGNEYHEGGLFFTPQVALYGFALNFGASLEFGLTENIGIGDTVMLAFWGDDFFQARTSFTLITPSVEGYYHFTKLDVDKLDLFAGAAVGFSIFSVTGGDLGGIFGSSGIFLSPILGGRYYFSEKIAACLKLYINVIGDWAGVGGVVGVTIVLK